MEFSKEQVEKLKEPILAANVKERDGNRAGTFQLAYVEGWHVINEANRIFGFDGWSSETIYTLCVADNNESVTYIAKVKVTVGNLFREGTGAGHGRFGSIGEKHESAIKEAETDARKRAFMQFGNQFGLSLYNGKDKSWKTNKAKPQNETLVPEQPSVTEMALKWIQKAPSQKHLDEIKKRLDAQMKEGNLSDSERHKLTNAIVQKEASLL
jgi:recombination DNA repair RAD52 pathway protein